VVFALGRELGDGAVALYEATVRDVLSRETALFGGPPAFAGASPVRKFVIIANLGSDHRGEALMRSTSMLLKEAPQPTNRARWGHLVTHELLHQWNGETLRAAAGEEEWLKEGFTDYFSYLILARAGFMSSDDFVRVLGRNYDRYVAVAGKISMRRGNHYTARSRAHRIEGNVDGRHESASAQRRRERKAAGTLWGIDRAIPRDAVGPNACPRRTRSWITRTRS
jgi:hypothetical protein